MSGRVRDRCSRRSLRLLLTVVLILVGAAIAVAAVDFRALLATAAAADRRLLLAAVLVYGCSWPLRGRRYDEILRAMDRGGELGFLTGAVFVSQSANLVVPARAGDGVRAYLINRRYRIPYPVGVASLAVERVFDLAALAFIGAAALGWLLVGGWAGASIGGVPPRGPILVSLAVGLGITGVAVATVAVARSDRAVGSSVQDAFAGTRWSRIVDASVTFGRAVREVGTNPRALAGIGLWSGGAWLLDVLSALLVVVAVHGADPTIGLSSTIAVGTLAVCAGNLAKSLPLTHGGIGVYEAAFAGVLATAGPIGASTAILAAVLDHAIKNAVTVAGGGIAAVAFDISPLGCTRHQDEAA